MSSRTNVSRAAAFLTFGAFATSLRVGHFRVPIDSMLQSTGAIIRRARNSWKAVIAIMQEWRRRRLQRSELLMLSGPELRDMLLTQSDADGEGREPFWRSIRLKARG